MPHPALAEIAHRPWPLPTARWTWRQTWRDLLFAHWPIPAAALRPLVPAGLAIEEHEGTSWIAVVPFRMTGVMRRPWPDVPGLSAFPELNVRVYVRHGGKPGVFFLSLDADQRLAVWAARRFFHLPYQRARMACTPDGDGFVYRSQRVAGPRPADFRARYRPTSPVYRAAKGSLEHGLTERYCLYAARPDGRLVRCQVHHAPWPLQRAEVEVEHNSMTAPHGLTVDGAPPLLHFAARIDVIVWSPELLD